ncbi:MAG: FtsX-like permease family protein, partial [Chitinispirillia bacterium]
FFRGFVGGMLQSIVKNSTKNETGHIRITTREFYEKSRFMPVTENIVNPEKIITMIRNNENIQKDLLLITERINFGVLLNNKGNNRSAMVLSGDPDIEKELLLLQNSLLPGGKYIRNERETILGANLADALNLDIGDTLKVMTQGSDYALHLRKFKISGIFKTGLNMLDNRLFQIPLHDAKKLLRMGDATQQIIIMLRDYTKADKIAGQIRTILNDDDLAVVSWTEHGQWASMVEKASVIYNFIYFFIAFLGAFIITNIMMMVVLERKKEIGIIKSMGISRKEVMILFLFEGIFLGFIGSIAGITIGMIINVYFAVRGFDMTKMMGSFNFPIDPVLYFDISVTSLLNVLLIGILVSALVSMLPSWRASRMNAVDAIKSV